MLSAVPSFATRRLPDPRIEVLPGVFCSLCWHALSGVSGAERLRHVLKVFATTYLLFYLFETRSVPVGGRLGYLAMSQAY